jgi:GNAT superfamily N-acetyltransferase
MTTDRPARTARQGAPMPPIRQLGPADLRRCTALSVDRGWSPEKPKWAMLLGACEVFGMDAPDGKGLAGAVVLTRWGTDLAAVGMMLVAARYGRRGLGQALMEHLLRVAGEGTAVTLFATEMGQPLYEKLGFEPVRANVSYAGRLGVPTFSLDGSVSPDGIRSAGQADLPAILAADRAAFGADRERILSRLPGFADHIAVLDSGNGVEGYAAAWRNHVTSTVIGPLVAPDGLAARRLVNYLAARARTPVIRLDLDPDRPELPGWAQAHGLDPVARTRVMAHGKLVPRGLPERLFTPISVALA